MPRHLNPIVLYLTKYKERLKMDLFTLLEAQVVDRDAAASKEVLKVQAEIRDIERIISKIME